MTVVSKKYNIWSRSIMYQKIGDTQEKYKFLKIVEECRIWVNVFSYIPSLSVSRCCICCTEKEAKHWQREIESPC